MKMRRMQKIGKSKGKIGKSKGKRLKTSKERRIRKTMKRKRQ